MQFIIETGLGWKVGCFNAYLFYRTDPMSLVFPKVTKCTFYKSGPTGTIQVTKNLSDYVLV